MKKYIYTVFVGAHYWKSFSSERKAKQEASMLKKDGAKNVKINKQLDD